jgi:hypothetical protein
LAWQAECRTLSVPIQISAKVDQPKSVVVLKVAGKSLWWACEQGMNMLTELADGRSGGRQQIVLRAPGG